MGRVCFFFLFFFPLFLQAASLFPTVRVVQASASLLRGFKESLNLEKGMELKKREKIETKRTGIVDLEFYDGSQMRLGPRTVIEFKNLKRVGRYLQLDFYLHKGSIRIVSSKENKLLKWPLRIEIISSNAFFFPLYGDHLFLYLPVKRKSILYTSKGLAWLSTGFNKKSKRRLKEYQWSYVDRATKGVSPAKTFIHLPDTGIEGKAVKELYVKELKVRKVKKGKELDFSSIYDNAPLLPSHTGDMEKAFELVEAGIKPKKPMIPLVKSPNLLFRKRDRDISAIKACFEGTPKKVYFAYCNEMRKHLGQKKGPFPECMNKDYRLQNASLCLDGFNHQKYMEVDVLKDRCEQDLLFRGRNLMACRWHLKVRKRRKEIEFRKEEE